MLGKREPIYEKQTREKERERESDLVNREAINEKQPREKGRERERDLGEARTDIREANQREGEGEGEGSR